MFKRLVPSIRDHVPSPVTTEEEVGLLTVVLTDRKSSGWPSQFAVHDLPTVPGWPVPFIDHRPADHAGASDQLGWLLHPLSESFAEKRPLSESVEDSDSGGGGGKVASVRYY
jgi:hypothetical protein